MTNADTNTLCIDQEYIYIIDTNHDANDFAAELCAYVTGYINEDCRIDEEVNHYAILFENDFREQKYPFSDTQIEKDNGDGIWLPYAVWPSKTWGSNEEGQAALLTPENYKIYDLPAGYSVGLYFDQQLPTDLFNIFKQRVVDFCERIYVDRLKLEGIRLISHIKTATEIKL